MDKQLSDTDEYDYSKNHKSESESEEPKIESESEEDIKHESESEKEPKIELKTKEKKEIIVESYAEKNGLIHIHVSDASDEEFIDPNEQDSEPERKETETQSSLLKKKRKNFIQEWNENEKKFTKKYNKRDIIRGPRSAWIYFIQSNRGNCAVPHTSKPLSEKWKTMSQEEKNPYYDKESEDFDRYRKEMKLLNDTDRKLLRMIKKRKREEKAKIYPKRCLTAYHLFLQEERPKIIKENPTFKFAEIGKELGNRWKNISIELKATFLQRAEKERKKYKDEKAKYRSVLTKEDLKRHTAYTCKNPSSKRASKVPMTLVIAPNNIL